MTDADLKRRKGAADGAAARREQLAGALGELLRRLKAECGCRNVDEAEALTKKLEAELRELERREAAVCNAFDEQWPDLAR